MLLCLCVGREIQAGSRWRFRRRRVNFSSFAKGEKGSEDREEKREKGVEKTEGYQRPWRELKVGTGGHSAL